MIIVVKVTAYQEDSPEPSYEVVTVLPNRESNWEYYETGLIGSVVLGMIDKAQTELKALLEKNNVIY